ncbi:MAG: hypothetical protein ACOY3D_01815, partial [Candidatus Omnitrophota bacterium]
EQIFKAVYSNEEIIGEELCSNAAFKLLFRALNTPRVVRRGLQDDAFPGAKDWLEALYICLYEIKDKLFAEFLTSKLPLHIQFIQASLYEARSRKEDPRVTDIRVKDTLTNTTDARNAAINCKSDEEFYILLKEKIWPALEELLLEDLNQILARDMANQGKVQLPKEQQALAQQGEPIDLSSLSKEDQQRIREKAEQIKDEMSKERKSALEAELASLSQRGYKLVLQGDFAEGIGSVELDPEDMQKILEQAEGNKTKKDLQDLLGQLRQNAASAQNKAGEIGDAAQGISEKLDAVRQRSGATEDMNNLAQHLKDLLDKLLAKQQELKRETGEFKEGADNLSGKAAKAQNRIPGQLPEDMNKDIGQLSDKAKGIDAKAKEIERLSKELDQSIERLRKLIENEPGDAQELRPQLDRTDKANQNTAAKSAEVTKEIKDSQATLDKLAEKIKKIGQKPVSHPEQQPQAPVPPLDDMTQRLLEKAKRLIQAAANQPGKERQTGKGFAPGSGTGIAYEGRSRPITQQDIDSYNDHAPTNRNQIARMAPQMAHWFSKIDLDGGYLTSKGRVTRAALNSIARGRPKLEKAMIAEGIRGRLVFVIDVSGSMGDDKPGEELWDVKVVVATFLELASHSSLQGRLDIMVIIYADSHAMILRFGERQSRENKARVLREISAKLVGSYTEDKPAYQEAFKAIAVERARKG